MTTSHTPGPWKVFDPMVDGDTYGIDGADGTAVVYYGYRDTEDGIPKKADACLIAAAPDLLLALERITSSYRSLLARRPVRDVDETLAEVDAALAKARGET